MSVSQKCQYALRAVFELGQRWGQGLVPVSEIARAQAIPPRFLENILNQMRQAGYVDSRRGKGGGVQLRRPPSDITVADVIRTIDGEIYSISCSGTPPVQPCSIRGTCVFLPIWVEARSALEDVYSSRTIQDLIEEHAPLLEPEYHI
ncbi:Rrf2 family transcriptional regulator [Phaeovibrio sulfidiphilus]|uniref:Rrf2 family transcriptional regulator n=1 Tax=Phaeovibrio sulfidiphilus TaxID=1220600 RepID=A0A8J6YMJ6_9PROT|nr:Rrf2 family transcriptional regulator [Phaeovibrio sulfidiphilus]